MNPDRYSEWYDCIDDKSDLTNYLEALNLQQNWALYQNEENPLTECIDNMNMYKNAILSTKVGAHLLSTSLFLLVSSLILFN